MNDPLIVLFLALVAAICNALMIWHHDREIKARDREIRRQDAVIVELRVALADAEYRLDEQRLAHAIKRFRGRLEYAYIGLDNKAADAGYDVYVN